MTPPDHNRNTLAEAVLGTAIAAMLTALALLAACLLTGCAPQRAPQCPAVLTATVAERHTRATRADTLHWTLPPQRAERTTADTASVLENDHCRSEASVDSAGRLHHTLATKPGASVTVPVTHTADTVERVIEKPVPVPVPTPVAHELTKWERMCLDTWPYLATALTLLMFWLLRSKIIPILRGFFRKIP